MDIDDKEDKVYGSQELSLFNTNFNCYQPLYIYEGQTGNAKLLHLAQRLMNKPKSLHAGSGKTGRLYRTWDYQAGTWASSRRIICKAEVTPQGDNIRFVVTTLQRARPSFIYKTIYWTRKPRCRTSNAAWR